MLLRNKDLLWMLKHPRTMLKVWYVSSDSLFMKAVRGALNKSHLSYHARYAKNTLLRAMPSEQLKDVLMEFLYIALYIKRKAAEVKSTHEADEFNTTMSLYLGNSQYFSLISTRNIVTNESTFDPKNYREIVDEIIDSQKLMKIPCCKDAMSIRFREAVNAFCELFAENEAAMGYAELKSTIVGCFEFVEAIDSHR